MIHQSRNLDRRYWYWYFTDIEDETRDGPIEYVDNHWRSQAGRIVSYPHAVMNDFGDLIPVEP